MRHVQCELIHGATTRIHSQDSPVVSLDLYERTTLGRNVFVQDLCSSDRPAALAWAGLNVVNGLPPAPFILAGIARVPISTSEGRVQLAGLKRIHSRILACGRTCLLLPRIGKGFRGLVSCTFGGKTTLLPLYCFIRHPCLLVGRVLRAFRLVLRMSVIPHGDGADD